MLNPSILLIMLTDPNVHLHQLLELHIVTDLSEVIKTCWSVSRVLLLMVEFHSLGECVVQYVGVNILRKVVGYCFRDLK